jgi:rhodanese-related sulfurtransferase
LFLPLLPVLAPAARDSGSAGPAHAAADTGGPSARLPGAAAPAAGDTGTGLAKKSQDSSRPDPVKAKLAARQERKLRTEYLKATAGISGPTLKADSLRRLLDDTDLVLIDVRHPDEQAVSMIPHALTLVEFAEKFRKGIPKAKRLVVYCTLGYRSGKYAMELALKGIRAENLEGGLLAWTHAGGPLEVRNAAGLATPTRRVHIYSSGWNFVHPDYEAVW